MNMRITTLLLLFTSIFWASCSEDDDVSLPVTVNFTNQESGITRDSPSAELSLTFSRAAPGGGTVVLKIAAADLTYGQEADFYSDPEAENYLVSLPYEAGDEELKLTIYAGSSLNIQQDKSITVSVEELDSHMTVGNHDKAAVIFSENFVATGGTIELNAGGENFKHQAYFDFSKLKQTVVDKYSWDLGFYNKSGEYRVVLNSGAYTMARPIGKSDLTLVTAADTLNFNYEMRIPPANFDPGIGAIAWVDTPDGNLETTAFGTIHEDNADNKVYIIKRDGDRNWKKVRVIKNSEKYVLEYADVNAISFETLEIPKDDTYNFSFVDLDKAIVLVEPAKESWDIMYGTFTESLNLGGPGMDIPYGYKDFIISNRNDTKVAMVLNADIPYEDFALGDIEALEFDAAIDALGQNWRSGGGPSSGPALYDDRYFVIEDAESNSYKLKFTRLTSTSGERGYPEFIFEKVD